MCKECFSRGFRFFAETLMTFNEFKNRMQSTEIEFNLKNDRLLKNVLKHFKTLSFN